MIIVNNSAMAFALPSPIIVFPWIGNKNKMKLNLIESDNLQALNGGRIYKYNNRFDANFCWSFLVVLWWFLLCLTKKRIFITGTKYYRLGNILKKIL